MRSILRCEPDEVEDDYTESHHGRGMDYDENFASLPFRALLWAWERDVVTDFVARTDARTVIDLACGTGRITRLLARGLPSADIIGVDVADSMLARAREQVPAARFVHVDLRRLAEVAPNDSVDLITAFRFFANADRSLRGAAVQSIVAAVRPGGYLLFNNHRNFWSPSYVMRRCRSRSAPGALNHALLDPLLKSGFEVVARRSLGVLPHTDRRVYFFPQVIGAGIERVNTRWLSGAHSIGTDTIWLLRRSPTGSRSGQRKLEC